MAEAEFSGKVALVTGGASGIGAEICRLLADRGAMVAVTDRDAEAARTLAAELSGRGGAAMGFGMDVTDPDAVLDAVARVTDRFGGPHLCANNAGIVTARQELALLSRSDWGRQIAVNLTGVFHCLQAEIPALIASGGGAIVNTTSICGLVGVAGTAAYAAAKHGVVGLTRVAALDYAARKIRVNALAPGYVDTPLIADRPAEERATIAARHPVERMARAREIAEAACYLLSDRASFVTGTVLAADGGYTAR